MNNKTDFLKEIEGYTIEELELIYETQKDLYSEEEMALIYEQIKHLEKMEQERIDKSHPKEIACSKCGGPNLFENDHCVFCGEKIIKNNYEESDPYNRVDNSEKTDDDNLSRYLYSVLVPVVGYILGAILLSKDSDEERNVGTKCIRLSVVATWIIAIIYWLLQQ